MKEILSQSDMIISKKAFVVGLPRSGSSLLSRIFNESKSLFSINDLYYLQKVDELSCFNRVLTEKSRKILLDHLISILETRSQKNNSFISGFSLTKDRFEELRDQVTTATQKASTWHELENITLTHFMREMGASIWIDKTPQNFWLLDVIWTDFPKANVIFIMRHPFDVLASLKYSSGEGHDKRRYQAFVYALYWRKAARVYLSRRVREQVLLLRYEDLVESTDHEIVRLGRFLDVSLENVNLNKLGGNSSFSKNNRKTITSFEKLICRFLAAKEMTELGYDPGNKAPFSLSGIGDFMERTLVFLTFQIRRFILDPDGRKRMYRFVKGS